MNKPIIGVSGNILTDVDGMFPGYRRSYVNEDYITSIVKNGGVPLIIPVISDRYLIEKQIEKIDGLILTGGYDISPRFYNEEPQQKLGDICPERDEFEFLLLELATKKNLPILGICRGIQILNVYYGGSLYQDLSYRKATTIKHWQAHYPSQVTHMINIDKSTKLFKILKERTLRVNSFHHQLIKNVPDNFLITAQANDGVVEAIERKDYTFMLGIQWHPEMLHQSVSRMNRQIFSALINMASRGKHYEEK